MNIVPLKSCQCTESAFDARRDEHPVLSPALGSNKSSRATASTPRREAPRCVSLASEILKAAVASRWQIPPRSRYGRRSPRASQSATLSAMSPGWRPRARRWTRGMTPPAGWTLLVCARASFSRKQHRGVPQTTLRLAVSCEGLPCAYHRASQVWRDIKGRRQFGRAMDVALSGSPKSQRSARCHLDGDLGYEDGLGGMTHPQDGSRSFAPARLRPCNAAWWGASHNAAFGGKLRPRTARVSPCESGLARHSIATRCVPYGDAPDADSCCHMRTVVSGVGFDLRRRVAD